MQVEVSDFDCKTLIQIINKTSFMGCNVEYIAALKKKFLSTASAPNTVATIEVDGENILH